MNRFWAIIVLAIVCVILWTAPLNAAPAVDGFSGVPWGATREQVQAAMAEKGFTLLEQMPGSSDKYKGTFAGHPAELKFSFNKNLFYFGEAIIRDIPAPEEIWSVASSFEDIKKLFIAKYGPASAEYTLGGTREERIGFGAKWYNLTAAATPTGQVSINVAGIKKRPQVQYYGIIISYDIGAAWAGMKADGGSI